MFNSHIFPDTYCSEHYKLIWSLTFEYTQGEKMSYGALDENICIDSSEYDDIRL